MMMRTHLAITTLVILLFLYHVSSKFLFVIVALITTLLPDIDTGFSTIGRIRASRFVQFLVRHRGLLHSFTFCIIVSILLACFLPVLAFAFFIAYSLHLFADSFTVEGIRPFWPFKGKSSWKIRTGSYTETSLFVFILLIDIFVAILIVSKIF